MKLIVAVLLLFVGYSSVNGQIDSRHDLLDEVPTIQANEWIGGVKPAGRKGGIMFHDVARDRVLLLFGQANGMFFDGSEVWAFDLKATDPLRFGGSVVAPWQSVVPINRPSGFPSGRADPVWGFDPTTNYLWVGYGRDLTGTLTDFWRFELTTHTWYPVSILNGNSVFPTGVYGAASGVVGSQLRVFFGMRAGDQTISSDQSYYMLDLRAPVLSWEVVSTGGGPQLPGGATDVIGVFEKPIPGCALFYLGQRSRSTATKNTFNWCAGRGWLQETDLASGLSSQVALGAVIAESSIPNFADSVIFGGNIAGGFSNDVYVHYDNIWTKQTWITSSQFLPIGRVDAQFVYVPREVRLPTTPSGFLHFSSYWVLFGGQSASGTILSDTWNFYDIRLSINSTAPTPTSGPVPTPVPTTAVPTPAPTQPPNPTPQPTLNTALPLLITGELKYDPALFTIDFFSTYVANCLGILGDRAIPPAVSQVRTVAHFASSRTDQLFPVTEVQFYLLDVTGTNNNAEAIARLWDMVLRNDACLGGTFLSIQLPYGGRATLGPAPVVPVVISPTPQAPCIRTCGNFPRACGSDGCGGTCATCGPNFACFNNIVCEPCGCTGLVCGDDGCGRSCGTCPTGFICARGACIPPPVVPTPIPTPIPTPLILKSPTPPPTPPPPQPTPAPIVPKPCTNCGDRAFPIKFDFEDVTDNIPHNCLERN